LHPSGFCPTVVVASPAEAAAFFFPPHAQLEPHWAAADATKQPTAHAQTKDIILQFIKSLLESGLTE
jgi:hypothetical protein